MRTIRNLSAAQIKGSQSNSRDGSHSGRLLFIAYYFPPLGGPASIRLGKTVKYLCRKGWEVDVISVKNIVYHSYDYELEQECRPDSIYRVPSLEIISLLYHLRRLVKCFQRMVFSTKDTEQDRSRAYFALPDFWRQLVKKLFIPDEKRGWLPSSYRQAMDLLRQKRYDFIITSIGPATAGILGHRLSKITGIPLVVDYRDHWTLHPHDDFLTLIHRKYAEYSEEAMLRQASLVTTVGETMKSELLSRFKDLKKEQVSVLYNGYDEEDFKDLISSASVSSPSRNRMVTFTYTGSLYPPITPLYLIDALKILKRKGELPSDLRFRFIGNYHRDMHRLLSDSELSGTISIVSNLPHKEVLQEMINSDILLLLLSEKGGKGILTSKAFEYLRSGRPVLAMIPAESEIAEIMKINKRHYFCSMEDRERISELIIKSYRDIVSSRNSDNITPVESNNNLYSEFSRENQVTKLTTLLSTIRTDRYEKN